MTNIKLYEFEPTRSARCRWTLLEAGLAYESLGNAPQTIGTPDVKAIHPLGKLPAAVIDGRPLFESAAISTAVADLVPEKNLVAKPGTWDRTLHEQWTLFVLTELDAWSWVTFVNTFVLPEDQRVTSGFEQNEAMFRRGAAVLDEVLGKNDHLVADAFSVTDIIVSYTLNGGRKLGYLEGFSNLQAYLDRMYAREHCTLDRS